MNLRLLKKYSYNKPSLKPDARRLSVNIFAFNKENIEKYNEIYQWIRTKKLPQLERTPAGNISHKHRIRPSYGVLIRATTIELTIILIDGIWRFQLRNDIKENQKVLNYINNAEADDAITGGAAFRILQKELGKDGINLNDYKIKNGEEVNATIEKPIIKMERPIFEHYVFYNVHHIDIHSAWPAGIARAYPEMAKTWERLYNNRKACPIYKQVLNKSIGVMHSRRHNFAWAQLAKAGIEGCNKQIRELANDLIYSGRQILSYNTDGIWYRGEVYHGEGEGDGLGQWRNDHINCRFRARSAGAYEYENDEEGYKPVLRGHTHLDDILDRSEWEWGDIYPAEAKKHHNVDTAIIQYDWDVEKGVIEKEENIWDLLLETKEHFEPLRNNVKKK